MKMPSSSTPERAEHSADAVAHGLDPLQVFQRVEVGHRRETADQRSTSSPRRRFELRNELAGLGALVVHAVRLRLRRTSLSAASSKVTYFAVSLTSTFVMRSGRRTTLRPMTHTSLPPYFARHSLPRIELAVRVREAHLRLTELHLSGILVKSLNSALSAPSFVPSPSGVASMVVVVALGHLPRQPKLLRIRRRGRCVERRRGLVGRFEHGLLPVLHERG
jgi:hypothetical protein